MTSFQGKPRESTNKDTLGYFPLYPLWDGILLLTQQFELFSYVSKPPLRTRGTKVCKLGRIGIDTWMIYPHENQHNWLENPHFQ